MYTHENWDNFPPRFYAGEIYLCKERPFQRIPEFCNSTSYAQSNERWQLTMPIQIADDQRSRYPSRPMESMVPLATQEQIRGHQVKQHAATHEGPVQELREHLARLRSRVD